MKIEAAELAGDVDDFANEEQTSSQARFHGFAGKFAGVDPAGGDFGFDVAFRVGRTDRPIVQLSFESSERGIGVVGRGVEVKPAIRKAIGQKLLESFARGGFIAAGGGAKFGGGVATRREIEMNGLGGLPVGRDLENCGAAEAAMGEEHFFAEGMLCGGGDDFGGDAGKLGVAAMIFAMKNERNEGGSCGNDVVAKLAGQVVAEGSSADFGNGEAAGGDDENGCTKFGGVGAKDEFGGALDFRDAGVEEDLDFGGATFGFEESSDVCGGTIAEKLAERFFVVGDAVLFDEGDEIGGSVAGQGGFGKVRICGMKIFGGGVKVGEIAAASTGNEDFLADAVGVFDDGDAATPFAGFEGTEKAGGASTKDQDIERTGQNGLTRKECRCQCTVDESWEEVRVLNRRRWGARGGGGVRT